MDVLASVRQPSTFRMLIWPEASNAQNSIAAVSADGSTVCVLIRRLNSSCRRSIALVVRALRHWLGGSRVKVKRRSPGRALAHELLNLIDAITTATAIKTVAAAVGCSNRFLRCCCFGFAAFSPNDGPIKHPINIGELANSVEPVAGNRQSFVRAPK